MDKFGLPELYSKHTDSLDEPRWLSRLKSLREIQGTVGPIDYDLDYLGLGGLTLKSQIRDALIQAEIERNGMWNLRADKPMWGGNMSLNLRPGNVYLQYTREF